MRTLLLMRHAKSSHDSEQLSDHDRPLDQRGRLDATRMGRFLIERNIVPQGFVSSTAVRARETAQLVMKGANQRGEPDLKAELYMAEPLAYVQVLSQLLFDFQRVMLVGHCPGIESTLGHFTGKARHMPTGAIAYIELPLNAWKEITMKSRGELLNLWLPKDLS